MRKIIVDTDPGHDDIMAILTAPTPATAATPAAEDGKVTPPEVEPLPPKKEFQLGDDLSLD